jgi:hypothetical protein
MPIQMIAVPGAEPEEPPAALQPVPPNAPPGMVPKGQFEANPFHMLRAQQAAKTGQPIRVPPNRKPGGTQYEKVPPGAQPAKPNGSKKPFQKDGLIWDFGDPDELQDENIVAVNEGIAAYLHARGVEDFNPYHDPETGRSISSEAGQGNVHKAGVSAAEGAIAGPRSAHSQRAMQQRQMIESPEGGDDARTMALKLAPAHLAVNRFMATPAVKAGIGGVVAKFFGHPAFRLER